MRTILLSNKLSEQESNTLLQNAETFEEEVNLLSSEFASAIKNLESDINQLTEVHQKLIKETIRTMEEDYSTCQTFEKLFEYVKQGNIAKIPKSICPTKFLTICLKEESLKKTLDVFREELDRVSKIKLE